MIMLALLQSSNVQVAKVIATPLTAVVSAP